VDTIVHAGERLHPPTLERATQHSTVADLSIVLGSSLCVPPASILATMVNRRRKKGARDNTEQFPKLKTKRTAEYGADTHQPLLLDSGPSANDEKNSSTSRNSTGKLVIINLGRTGKDRFAHLKIESDCDTVLRELLRALKLSLPE